MKFAICNETFNMKLRPWLITLSLLTTPLILIFFSGCSSNSQKADLIVYNGKVVLVNADDTLAEAMAIRGDKILRVGSNVEVLALKDSATEVIDLEGKAVLPGLIDSHTHPTSASMFEFDHELPEMHTIQDVLDYVRLQAGTVADKGWIVLEQIFITRLNEQRYPTRAELDLAAPHNPVIFRTGPDASMNSLALEHFEIDKDFEAPPGSKIEKQPGTGEPTGIIRGWGSIIDIPSTGRTPTDQDRYDRFRLLIADYNSVGITSIADRSTSKDSMALYKKMRDQGDLTVRVSMSRHVGYTGSIEDIEGEIKQIAQEPLFKDGDSMLKTVGVKMFLDGGMLTGSAYLREPWGVSQIYGIDDPLYRGIRFMTDEKLIPAVRTCVENGLQFTAHSVGDGAVHALIDAYETVAKETPIRATRPNITHSNFMSQEAVDRMARLGISADIQPAWLYLDTRTLSTQFGYDRMAYFQPLRSLFDAGVMVGGGSDHMQKIGSFRSVNPYNPFLGMWVAITRKARDYEGKLHPEQALTRMEAIRFYTMNNAFLLFQEERTGSLEAGKLADFVILDRDILTCPVDEIKEITVTRTYLNGQIVHSANP
ncbi:MAG: amidohydrolase [Verrucomicrobia bacterium]|nr:amidohydrolase [Verrucomicrobiota bacterium]